MSHLSFLSKMRFKVDCGLPGCTPCVLGGYQSVRVTSYFHLQGFVDGGETFRLRNVSNNQTTIQVLTAVETSCLMCFKTMGHVFWSNCLQNSKAEVFINLVLIVEYNFNFPLLYESQGPSGHKLESRFVFSFFVLPLSFYSDLSIFTFCVSIFSQRALVFSQGFSVFVWRFSSPFSCKLFFKRWRCPESNVTQRSFRNLMLQRDKWISAECLWVLQK